MRERHPRWQRQRLGGVLLCALVLGTGCAPVSRRATDETSLRVMSYNIQYGGGDLARIAEVIRGASPDLVGLQEVDVHWSERSRFADQATELGRLTGMQVRFARIYQLAPPGPGLPPREFGVALLSRHAISRWRNDTLTRLSTQDPNPAPQPMPGLLEAVVDIRGRSVRVFNTHLDYRADPAVRVAQVSEMIHQIGSLDGPTIVFGDMNATPDAQELQPLLRLMTDTWTPGTGPGLTYPADAPVKRIDFVLVSPQFRVRSATILSTTASDHRPMVVDLVLGGR